MKKTFRTPIIVAVLAFLATALPACGPKMGPAYIKPDKPADNVATVYIYRPTRFIGGGLPFSVKANGKTVTTLYNGGYHPHFAKPGELELSASTETTSSVTLDVKPGQAYYVKGWIGVGIIVGRPHLLIVEKDVAEQEIVQCKLVPEMTAEDRERADAPDERK